MNFLQNEFTNNFKMWKIIYNFLTMNSTLLIICEHINTFHPKNTQKMESKYKYSILS